jgi:peroxiredoxin
MVELGELEAHRKEFADRQVRVVVISNDDLEHARTTQTRFPGLVVVSDADQNMAKALQVIHPGAGENGEDTNAPTTFLLDGTGTVRWRFRPQQVITRLSPQALLAAIDGTR